ncbi:hypothetical protein [Pleionea sp. CnH1-48]|uniref:hypothetical protein n=1 Tax=Pleionea sp. CnH1-48 TaxID=2954494 RepID=UPI002096E8E4|nr:hypothetical protein [Pleionea sp. CnH1-48]MCO7226318.1 hypothetical protein [Pleionea sp. CnH1-48]
MFPGKPGKYNLKVATWLPRVKVSVFKSSVQQTNEWRVRCAGVVLDPGKILQQGHWEGPIS